MQAQNKQRKHKAAFSKLLLPAVGFSRGNLKKSWRSKLKKIAT
jgi:hypothetical protein